MQTTEDREPQTFTGWLVGGPSGFRRLLIRLGPTYVKIGQFLALRPDLIPQDYADELLRLFDDVQPFPWSEARAIIEADLGKIEQSFHSIDPQPRASGSLAQVHTAVLHNGEKVAIKVLRPGIQEQVESDLRRASRIGRVLRLAQVKLIADPLELINELTEWLHQELNLSTELENMIRLGKLANQSDIEFVPRPYPDLCSARVLTAEYVLGLPFSEILVALSHGHEEAVRQRWPDLNLNLLAQNLVQATLRQMFRYQFFHADVHPGNLMVLPNHVIGYVDFGLCEFMDENVRREQIRYLASVYDGDVPQMFKALLEILIPAEDADVESFRADFNEECARWLRGDSAEDSLGIRTSGRSPIAHWLIGIMRAARRNRFRLPRRLLAVYRTLLTAETVANRLDSRIDIRSEGKRFFISLQVDDALSSLEPEAIKQSLPRILSLLRDTPGQVNNLLAELADGRFTLRVEWADDARTRRASNRRTRLLATAICSVGFAFLLATPALWERGSTTMQYLLAAIVLALYISIVMQWRKLE
jgi:ubiquinone biosynthesis protein